MSQYHLVFSPSLNFVLIYFFHWNLSSNMQVCTVYTTAAIFTFTFCIFAQKTLVNMQLCLQFESNNFVSIGTLDFDCVVNLRSLVISYHPTARCLVNISCCLKWLSYNVFIKSQPHTAMNKDVKLWAWIIKIIAFSAHLRNFSKTLSRFRCGQECMSPIIHLHFSLNIILSPKSNYCSTTTACIGCKIYTSNTIWWGWFLYK